MAFERGFNEMGEELEIIQDELQLKLDVQCVKEQFLGLLENYTTYDDDRRPPHASRYIPPELAYGYCAPAQPAAAQYQTQQHVVISPRQPVVPRSICRCNHRSPQQNMAKNIQPEVVRGIPPQQPPQQYRNLRNQVVHIQNSSSSSDEHQRLMNRTRGQFMEQRVPPIGDYERHVMSYRQPHASPTSVTSSEDYDPHHQNGGPRAISSSRARVKAFYEHRHERLIARRARHGYPVQQNNTSAPTPTPVRSSSTSFSPASSTSDLDTFLHGGSHHDRLEEANHTNTPVLSVCSSSDSRERLLDCDDFRNNNTPPKSAKDPPPQHTLDSNRPEDPEYQNLTPITEEHSLSSRNNSGGTNGSGDIEDSPDEAPQLPPRCPLITPERYREYLSHKSPPEELGEYVTLKAPDQSMNSFFSECQSFAPGAPSILQPHDMTTCAPFAPAMLSMSFMSDTSSNSQGSNGHRRERHGSEPKDSPVRYAKSNVISELYTKYEKSLLDISQISNISASSIAPSSLSDSVLSNDYPLHSTMITSKISPGHRAKQKLSFSDDDSLLARTDDTLDSTLEGDTPGSLTSQEYYSGQSMYSKAYNPDAPYTTQLSMCSPKSEQSIFINQLSETENSVNVPGMTEDIFKTPKNPPRRPLSGEQPQHTQIEPTLCKEHGLHPTFGGPCIFEDSFDLIESDDSDLDFTSVNFNSEAGSKLSSKRSSLASTKISSKRSSWASKFSSKPSSVARHNSVADTDCDSSYLSECVDDTRITNDFSEAENYTATYDPRRARMRMVRMRRQTGRANIQRKHNPIGLSESDLLDSAEKHMSLQATRASMPDLHGMSSVSSYGPYSDDDLLDSTLQNSPTRSPYEDKSSLKESDMYNFDHDETIISAAPSDPRPLSVCTTTTQATATTDESPESQGAMTVPVNSPNVTDSGGSSSRQPTTDDYVDVPANLPKMAKMLESRLRSHAQYPENMTSVPIGFYRNRSRKRYPGSSAGSASQQSLGSKQSLHVCSDPHPDPGTFVSHKSRGRPVRKTINTAHGGLANSMGGSMGAIHHIRYPKSQDSGFNTQDSRARAVRAHELQLHQQQLQSKHPDMAGPRMQSGHRAHGSRGSGLDKERKKAWAKKLKQFNNNFNVSSGNPNEDLQIKTWFF